MKIFKVIASVIVMVVATGNASSQTNKDGSAPQFLYPEFIKGEVKLKNGKNQTVLLNFNTVSGKMTYKQNDKIFDIVNIETIDTVYLYKSKFVPVGESFYEILVNDKVTLMVKHAGELLPPGKPAGYGGTSQVSSSTYLSSVQLQSGYYNLDLPEDFEVKIEPEFWILKDGEMTMFISERQFMKIFPDKSSELKNYIKKNRIKFERIPDMINLVSYYNSLNQ